MEGQPKKAMVLPSCAGETSGSRDNWGTPKKAMGRSRQRIWWAQQPSKGVVDPECWERRPAGGGEDPAPWEPLPTRGGPYWGTPKKAMGRSRQRTRNVGSDCQPEEAKTRNAGSHCQPEEGKARHGGSCCQPEEEKTHHVVLKPGVEGDREEVENHHWKMDDIQPKE